MFNIIIILTAGLICGRIYLKVTGRKASLADTLLGYTVWAMLAAFGLRIGADPAIMERLPSLGLQALILGASAMTVSGMAVSLAFSRFTPAQPELTDTRRTSFTGRALMGSAVTLFFFAIGLTAGRLSLLPVSAADAGWWATRLLELLIGLVGIATGSNPRLSAILREMRPVIIAVPLIALATSLLGGAAAGLFLPLGPSDGMLAVSGMGYYSLSSMIISDLRADDMGEAAAMSLAAVALMANIVREILALVTIPVAARSIGLYGSTAMCGVTSLDVTLPTLATAFGAEAIPVALVNGIILEVTTPFTVTAACWMVGAWG